MTQRTFRRAGGPGRRTRPIRRASAGLTPTRAGAALAMLVSALAVYGLSATSAFGFARLEIDGNDDHGRDCGPGTPRAGRRREPVRDRHRAARGPHPRDTRGRGRRDLARACPTPWPSGSRSACRSSCGRSGVRSLLVDTTGLLFARLDKSPPAFVADLPVIADDRAEIDEAPGRPHAQPRRSRRRDPPGVADARRGRQRRDRAVSRGDRRQRLRAQLRSGELGRGVRLLHARACARPTSSRARSRRCGSC